MHPSTFLAQHLEEELQEADKFGTGQKIDSSEAKAAKKLVLKGVCFALNAHSEMHLARGILSIFHFHNLQRLLT